MSSVLEIDGLIGWAALAAPLVFLAAGLLMALLWPYRPPAAAGRIPSSSKQAPPSGADHASLRLASSESGINNSADSQSLSLTRSIPFEQVPGELIAEPNEDLTIDASICDGRAYPAHELPKTAVEVTPARAMINEALVELAAGDRTAAAENLREAIMLASKVGDRTLHALARLELGDIAQADGDLQTACEHWQLARSLFEEVKSSTDAAKCEKRMSLNGCPTDWVLNDF